MLNEDFQLDANFHRMMRESKYVIIQYTVLFVSNIVSMILLCKTKWYFRALPYTLALMNVCLLPIWPVIGFKMCI